MNARTSSQVMAIVAAISLLPSLTSGQGYQPPAGPTMSPYLDYFGVPVGPWMDNYHTFVRPRADLRSNLNQLGTAVNRQERRLNQLGNDLQKMSPAPTGTASTFMNHSKYFINHSKYFPGLGQR